MLNHIKFMGLSFIENLRERDKTARRWFCIICGLAVLIVVGIIGIIRLNWKYTDFDVVKVTDKTDDVSVNYQVIGDGLVRYSKDGAFYTDKNGVQLWDQAFEMSNAAVAVSGNYMVFADIGSNQIRIFNQSGQVAAINALYPVANVKIANQGVVAAILSDASQHFICLYDANGVELVKIKATMANTGYPIDLAISEDGTKLAVSYLMMAGGEIKTRIVFYRFGETSVEKTDNIEGNFEYNEIFSKISFINNNTLVAFGEKGFEMFTIKDKEATVVLEKTFDTEIKSIFYNEHYIGFVFRNDDINETDQMNQENTDVGVIEEVDRQHLLSFVESEETSEESETLNIQSETMSLYENEEDVGELDGIYPSLNQNNAETAEELSGLDNDQHRYKLLVYTNAGKLYLDKSFDFDFHVIECTDEDIIMYNENECYILNYKGKEKFKYNFEYKINALLPKQSSNEYIIIDDNTIREIKLK